MINKDKLIEKFTEYVNNYDMENDNISRKYYHSMRVMDFATEIADSIGANDNLKELSVVVGLLHDYARFEQWTRYQTYSDVASIDHGDFGVELLFDNKEIEGFYDNHDNYQIIYDAIKYHNKLNIKEDITGDDLTMCKIIRDADKLDILNLSINNKGYIKECDEEITDCVDEQFMSESCINRKTCKNHTSKQVLVKLALMYDFNYDYSYKYLIQNNVLWRIFENVQNKERFKKYFDFMEQVLLKRAGLDN